MKKMILFFAVILIAVTNVCAQKNPVPSYLISKPFSKEVLEFKLTSLEGKKISLGEVLDAHKGRKIVLDFWASWCRDCLKDFPAAKKIKSKTKNTDYVYISLDKEEEHWKKAIKSWEIKGDHYYIKEGWKNELTKYVDLDWIPRYIVLDEKGIISVPKAIKISDKKIKKLVN